MKRNLIKVQCFFGSAERELCSSEVIARVHFSWIQRARLGEGSLRWIVLLLRRVRHSKKLPAARARRILFGEQTEGSDSSLEIPVAECSEAARRLVAGGLNREQ